LLSTGWFQERTRA